MPSNIIFDAYEAYRMDIKSMGRKRSSKRSTVNCLYSCLMLEVYPHVLRWTENEREFSILFRRKGSTDWKTSDLDFFKELDSLSLTKKLKYLNQPDYDQGCKRRCKANLQKLCKDKILEYVRKRSIGKGAKMKYYKFLEIPNKEEICYKHFPVIKKRRSNDNIDVINERTKCNFSNEESNNRAMYFEEFRDVACLLDAEENIELQQIKVSLPGYDLPKKSLSQCLPLWSNDSFTPYIKNVKNLDELVNFL